MRSREEVEKAEDARLAPWGARAARSGGRLYAESEHAYRTAFQRDRDRVVHATAFRRLQYKTQVFVHHEGDHFRNRLTHTIEAGQIARTIARALGANEDLTEAIVLAHDLGHTPFGHSGERALDAQVAAAGGFEHNRQSLRIVDLLERRSPRFRGLNLTRETRAGVLKHGADFGAYRHPLPLPELGASPSLEAQIADLSDEIAYDNHDIDDGLRSGLLELDALLEQPLWREAWERASDAGDDARLRRARAIASLIDTLAGDVIRTSQEGLERAGGPSPAAVEASAEHLVGFSPAVAAGMRELSRFLRESLYAHPQVLRMAAKGERIVRELWEAYTADPRLLPADALQPIEGEPPERALADWLAGMTDRFALAEHAKLFDPNAPV